MQSGVVARGRCGQCKGLEPGKGGIVTATQRDGNKGTKRGYDGGLISCDKYSP